MAEFYKVGYQLKYIDGKWNYIHGYGDTNNHNIQLCREKPYVGSWEGFWCSYNFENLIPDRGGLQSNFNEQMGIAFSAGGNYKPGIFVTETLYSGRSPDAIYVPYTEMLTTFSPDNRPYSGSVLMSVLQHLGNDNYRIHVRIIINNLGTYEKIYESKKIPTNTLNTVYIGGTYNQGRATCKIYNIQIADAWKINYENEIKLPKLNLCPIGKVNWTAVDFRDNIYSETVNCQIEQEKITINNNGYTASPAVPQLGAQHHVVYRVFFNSDPTALPFTINVGHFAENDTTMRMGVTLYGIRANDELYISQDPQYFNNVSFVGQTNVNGKIIEASGRVWGVSVRKTFDNSPSLVNGIPYVYCTTIVCVYDDIRVYKKFEYKSREPYVNGQTIRFATRAINIENSVIVSTFGEQFVATSGFENQCVGVIITDFDHEVDEIDTLKINFIDKTVSQFKITSYLWDFGDGTTSSEKDPAHMFLSYGSFDVTLTTTDTIGNVDAITKRVIIKSVSNKINYAIEIYPNSKDVWTTKEEYGIQADAIRLITGRPNYLGGQNDSKVYSSNEIDINGNDISNNNNTSKYFEGLLTKDGLSGPSYSIDVETTANINLDTEFSFSIRNDTGFLNYCNLNRIILNNRKVKFWVVIEDVFYSAGFGEITNITQSQESINISVEKSFKQFDKQIPNTYATTEYDPGTGDYKEEVMPIVLGDVDHSKISKEELTILPIPITKDSNTICPAIYYNWNRPQKYYEDYLSYTRDEYYTYIDLYTYDYTIVDGVAHGIFSDNDPKIMGELVGLEYPNRKWLYIKYGEKIPENSFVRIRGVKDMTQKYLRTSYNRSVGIYIPVAGNSIMGVTRIFLEDNLLDSDDKVIFTDTFNSTANGYGSIQKRTYGKYCNALYGNPEITCWSEEDQDGPGNIIPLGGSDKTWWFQIVDLNCKYILSTDSSTCQLQIDDNNNIVANIFKDDVSYETEKTTVKDKNNNNIDVVKELIKKDEKNYVSISNLVDINSEANDLRVKSNVFSEDEAVTKMSRLPYQLKSFGVWIGDEYSKIVEKGGAFLSEEPDSYSWNTLGYELGFTTFDETKIGYVTNNKRIRDLDPEFIENPNPFQLGSNPSNNTFITASFEVNKTLEELPDTIYFLADFSMCNSHKVDCKLGNLTWKAIDIYDKVVFSSTTSMNPTLAPVVHKILAYPAWTHFNLIPNSYYRDVDLMGDYYSMFDAASQVASADLEQLKQYFSLDKQTLDVENFLKKQIIKEIRVYFSINSQGLIPNPYSNFRVGIKQLGLFGEEKVEILDEDIYLKVKGEKCLQTSTEPLAETNNFYTMFVHLLEDYCKIDKKFIDYTNLEDKRWNWYGGRTLYERKNAIEYFSDLTSNSFVQIFPTRQGKIRLKPFDYFNNFQTELLVEKYYGVGTSGVYTVYSQIEVCFDTGSYILRIMYKTSEQIGTENYYSLTEHTGLFVNDEVNKKLNLYNSSNVLIYQLSYNKLSETGATLTIILNLNDDNVVMNYVGNYKDYEFDELPEITVLHDNNIIIKDSLEEIEVTDITDCYNNFKVKWNYDENFNKFLNEICVNKIDELEHFPSFNEDWEGLVTGLREKGSPETSQQRLVRYDFCNFFWSACKQSYDYTGNLNEPGDDVQEINWCNNDNFEYSTSEKTAIKYFKLIVQWLSKQKQIVSYSVPLSETTITLELLDLINFKDVLLTENVELKAFIVDKKINVEDDLIDLTIMLLPMFNDVIFDTILELGTTENTIEETGIEVNEFKEFEL